MAHWRGNPFESLGREGERWWGVSTKEWVNQRLRKQKPT